MLLCQVLWCLLALSERFGSYTMCSQGICRGLCKQRPLGACQVLQHLGLLEASLCTLKRPRQAQDAGSRTSCYSIPLTRNTKQSLLSCMLT